MAALDCDTHWEFDVDCLMHQSQLIFKKMLSMMDDVLQVGNNVNMYTRVEGHNVTI